MVKQAQGERIGARTVRKESAMEEIGSRHESDMSRYCSWAQISGVFKYIVVYMLYLWLDFLSNYRWRCLSITHLVFRKL